MHAVLMNSLEEYLSGTLKPAELAEIEAHVTSCALCREELHGMQEVSMLFGSLRTDELVEPSAGFAAKVIQQVRREKPAPSFASWIGLDLVFGRRLAFASLVMLAVLGSYLVTRESGYSAGPSPEAILAQQNGPAFDTARAEDNMLMTLTAYEH